jgi:hypothetical protein
MPGRSMRASSKRSSLNAGIERRSVGRIRVAAERDN